MLLWAHVALAVAGALASLVALLQGAGIVWLKGAGRPGPLGRLVARHVRWGWVACLLMIGAFASGVFSLGVIRGADVLETWHGWFGIGLLAAFVSASVLGQRIRAGSGGVPLVHAATCMVSALLFGLATWRGLALLP